MPMKSKKGTSNTVLNLRLSKVAGVTHLLARTDGEKLWFELEQTAENIEHTTPLTDEQARFFLEMERARR